MAASLPLRKNALRVFGDQWTNAAWLARYLDLEEQELVAAAVRELQGRLRKAAKSHGPLALMRLEGVLTLYVLARRVGLDALRAGLRFADDGADDSPSGNTPRPADGDDVGKALERLRKALKEFEDSTAQAPESNGSGLADLLRPLLKNTDGVLEEALASGTDSGNGCAGGDGPRSNGSKQREAVEPADSA